MRSPLSVAKRDGLQSLLKKPSQSSPRSSNPNVCCQFNHLVWLYTLYFHPMNAKIGVEAWPAVRQAFNASVLGGVFWRPFAAEAIQFRISCFQLYNDKFQTLLDAPASEFYPLHVTFPSFSEEWRWKHFARVQTTLAYLQELFDSQEHKGIMELPVDQKMKYFSLVGVLHALHQSVELILEPLPAVAL